ncbi:MAG: phosphoribosylglycinamide formyltransferase [Ardenticatenaceae bacterium]|nr:phosphoribosylglycinamide formyltransferase [Ardenticatenaceae bacterium]
MSRLVVLISGGGSNLQALIDAAQSGHLPADIAAVISNKKSAYGLERAAAVGIPSIFLSAKGFPDRESYDVALARMVREHRPDLIVLAGFMRILSPAFLDQFPGRVINLHPALPGRFAGTRAIERAFAAFQAGEITASGCMVHYAIPEVDAGPVIEYREVGFEPHDTLDTFAARLHGAEHELIVSATRKALRGMGERE